MSSGRGRVSYSNALRKPGEISQNSNVENEEKPPVEAAVVSNQPDDDGKEDQIKQEISSDNQEPKLNKTDEPSKGYDHVLLKAVNTPAFVPKSFQGSGASSSSVFASAINAREFIPGKPFYTFEKTPAERIEAIRTFVTKQLKQAQDDPGLIEEISACMDTYLSLSIKVEDDLRILTDILFEKCVSEPNFQYIGAKIANHLDKNLKVQGLQTGFRDIFLKRCRDTNKKVNEMILNNPTKVPNVAMFLGELLMTFKTVEGESIGIFCKVVSTIINSLLDSSNPKLHICAGKVLKLTGGSLEQTEQTEEIFKKVLNMATDHNTDRTAQIIFNRVCELKTMNWYKNECSSVSEPSLPTASLPESSLYIPNMNTLLEEQIDELPVYTEEEWNDFVIDGEDDSTDQLFTSTDATEQLYRQSYYEQYGYYQHGYNTPYT